MTIELRLSSVEPPAPEPKRTIYRDIVNLPEPVKLGITVRYFNYDSVTLYFQITGSGAGYTFGTVNLGALGAGLNAYINLDEFASRAKPSAELEETITLILKAYTDSGYTDLKWTYNRTVTVKFINSADPSYIWDVLNNFDDGTVQGWAIKNLSYIGQAGTPSLAVAADYVLSPPYSLKGTQDYSPYVLNQSIWIKYLQVTRDGTILIHLGKPHDTVAAHYVPLDKWMRLIALLPKNTTLELRLVWDSYLTYNNWGSVNCLYKSFNTPNRDTIYAIADVRLGNYNGAGYYQTYLWLDDFKIISK